MRLVVKAFPLANHDLARPAAEAARCAAAQGRFWEYHDRLFTEQPRFERERLVHYAVDLGLDTGAFTRCLDDRTAARAVAADVAQARALGVSSTPTFLIDNRLLIGAHPIETFRKVIDEALRGH